jgi:hypothetical protein
VQKPTEQRGRRTEEEPIQREHEPIYTWPITETIHNQEERGGSASSISEKFE